MGPMLKGSLGTFAVMVLSEVFYKLYIYWRQGWSVTKSESLTSSEIMEVIFFPDKKIACRTHFLGDTPCFKDNCKYSHDKTSLSQLYKHLSSCRSTMDVCMFVLTCDELVDIIRNIHKRGVLVRVITDKEQETISGSQVWSLRKYGINIRTNNSSFYMHHKFVVVDRQILINGSFNWTRKAITGNQENVIITNHQKAVSAFQAEFERLWLHFDPRNTFNSELSKWQQDDVGSVKTI